METIVVSKRIYDELVANSQKLAALESTGVDNWEGYAEAVGGDDEEETSEDIYGTD